MTIITRDSFAQAAQEGTGIAHLSPGQAWAGHRLTMAPERLSLPPAPHIAALLENIERKVTREFFAGADRDDARIAAGYSLSVAKGDAYLWASNSEKKANVYKAIQKARADRAEYESRGPTRRIQSWRYRQAGQVLGAVRTR